MEAPSLHLERSHPSGLALLTCASAIAVMMIAISMREVVAAGSGPLPGFALLALAMALFSTRRLIPLPGSHNSVFLWEALACFSIIMVGPFHGVVLVALGAGLAARRQKRATRELLFSVAANTISIYCAARVHHVVNLYVASHDLPAGAGGELLAFALPSVALGLTYYVLRWASAAAMLARIAGRSAVASFRETFPWEPVTITASATVAGLIDHVYHEHGLITTAVTTLLIVPLPTIIYYTFRTYHDKIAEKENHYQELTSVYDSILEMLAMAIDAKDDVTHDHIQRVKLFARRMGELIGLSKDEIDALKAGALLHDIGKIGVPAYILNKPGKLTEHEFEQMKMHTVIGADMLSNVDFRYPVVPIVRHHHERWDGRGYPDGLRGEEIPITARIMTLVDNYDALRSDRPYKKGMSREEALAYIKQNARTFFDPKLVEIFLATIDELEVEAASFKKSRMNKRNQALASAVGPARARKIDRATAALNSIAETNQRVTALYEMSRTLGSMLSLEDTVTILASRLSKLIPFTTCAISLLDRSRSEFEVVHSIGLRSERFLKRRQPLSAGITGWVISNHAPMYNTNPALDLAFLGANEAREYKASIVFPLTKNDGALGAVALYSTELESYGSEHIQLLESISQPASDAVYNAIAFEQAQRAAITDPVTGLVSKRALVAQFEREHARSVRLGNPLSLIVIRGAAAEPSDTLSRSAASLRLAHLGGVIKQQIREIDMVGRQASDQFVVLLPGSGQAEAAEVCDRIRHAIRRAGSDHYDQARLVIDFGCATSPDGGNGFEELLQTALDNCTAGSNTADPLSAALSHLVSTESM